MDKLVLLYEGKEGGDTSEIYIGALSPYMGDAIWTKPLGECWWDGVEWKGDMDARDQYAPTHWMPLPEPPYAQAKVAKKDATPEPCSDEQWAHPAHGVVTISHPWGADTYLVRDAAGRNQVVFRRELKPLPAPQPSLGRLTAMVRCPTCHQPAKVLWEAEEAGAGDGPDRSRKGWRCGCEACDCTFFLPKYPVFAPAAQGKEPRP